MPHPLTAQYAALDAALGSLGDDLAAVVCTPAYRMARIRLEEAQMAGDLGGERVALEELVRLVRRPHA